MAGHGEKLSRKQEQAIAALLQAPTIKAAAEQVPVSYRTLKAWLRLPAFLAAYRDARRAVVEQAVAQLQRLTGQAVRAVRRNLRSGKAAVEVAAAFGVLDRALKGVELLDLEGRLAALEAEAQAEKDRA